MRGFVRLLSQLKLWRKRVAIVASKSPFARAVAAGFERAAEERNARRRGVRIRVKWNGAFDPASTPARLFPALVRNRVNALASAGSYDHDVAVMRAVAESRLNIPVLGCVAAGVARFATDLGELSEGIVGPSQWEDSLDLEPALGPTPAEFARRMRTAGVDLRLSRCADLRRWPPRLPPRSRTPADATTRFFARHSPTCAPPRCTATSHSIPQAARSDTRCCSCNGMADAR